jgi:uncharacterized membrane protein
MSLLEAEPRTREADKPVGVEKTSTAASRISFLDWTRGVAAVIMMQGHTFHAFAQPGIRQESAYILSQFFGGLAPAVFLFLTGITFAFGMDRRERREMSAWQKITAALGRARYLFALAILFRLQLWAFAYPRSHWSDLFKVDILNCMGVSMALLAWLAVLEPARRMRYAAFAGVALAAVAPLLSQIDQARLPWLIKNYFVPSYDYFAVFPWSSYLAFGIAAGSILKQVPRERLSTMIQWTALAGFGLILGGQYFSNLPYSLYDKSEFWLNSPGLIFIKLGCIFLLASVAYVWNRYGTAGGFSWVRQLGTTSLLVYWVHIELVYGRWFTSAKDTMTAWQCAFWSVALVGTMLALSVAKTQFAKWRAERRDLAMAA